MLPPDAIIIPNPYKIYLNSLPHDTVPMKLVIVKESSALRSIFPLIDNQVNIESIVDPGSQIITMSEYICNDLGIYDPSIVLNMQSANGEVDQSLGLARNVPMTIGEITLYACHLESSIRHTPQPAFRHTDREYCLQFCQ